MTSATDRDSNTWPDTRTPDDPQPRDPRWGNDKDPLKHLTPEQRDTTEDAWLAEQAGRAGR